MIFAAIGMVASGGALPNGFFWDDPVVLDRQLPTIGGLRGAFFPPVGLPQWSAAYYRPLVTLSLLADRALWGARPLGYHLTVLLLHGLVCGLVYLVARRLIVRSIGPEPAGRSRSAELGAAAAALLFAVHPVHAEAVAWISGRADVLATLGVVLVMLLALGPVRTWSGLGASAISSRQANERSEMGETAGTKATDTDPVANESAPSSLTLFLIGLTATAALLSKEPAIVLPILLLLIGLVLPVGAKAREDRRRILAALGATCVGFAVALGLRFVALGGLGRTASAGEDHPGGVGIAPAGNLARLVSAAAHAARRLLLPWPWTGFHGRVEVAGAADLLALIALLALVALACWASRAGRTGGLFTIVTLAFALMPVLVPVSLSPVADRYLYLPSVGLILMVGALVGRASQPPGQATWHSISPVAPTGPVIDLRRSHESSDSTRSEMPQVASQSSESGLSIDSIDPSLGRPRAALTLGAYALAAIALTCLASLNVAAVSRYRDDLTFWGATVSAQARPDPYARLKLGQALGGAQRFDEAEAQIRQALAGDLTPADRTIALDNLGDIALRRGRLDEAGVWLERAAQSAPGFALAHVHLARLHRALAYRAKDAAAAATENRGPGHGSVPTQAPGADHAATSAGERREGAESEHLLAAASLAHALALEPANTEALLLSADLALDAGDRARAAAAIREALRYLPEGEQRRRAMDALGALGG